MNQPETVTKTTSILQIMKLKDKKRRFENKEPIFKFIVNNFFSLNCNSILSQIWDQMKWGESGGGRSIYVSLSILMSLFYDFIFATVFLEDVCLFWRLIFSGVCWFKMFTILITRYGIFLKYFYSYRSLHNWDKKRKMVCWSVITIKEDWN